MKNNFETLMTRLTPTLRRISHRLNGHFTFFNDDDLCQEALVHLWVMFRENRLSDKTDSYILQGCYYHLKNHIRTSMDKVRPASLEEPIDDDGTMLEEIVASSDPSQAEQLSDKTLYEEALKSGLTEREINILDMCRDGLTTREIGDKLGISHVAVVKIQKRIRIKCGGLEKEIRDSYQN
jgi:RNA polymerase sigma factor (sigma-70 family)